MKLSWRRALLFGSMGLYVACAPKKFSKDPEFNACQNSGKSCVSQNGRDYFTISETVAGGKVDVLVVTDNSASMSAEQKALGDRFNGFIQKLESKAIDYRIGVVTTDISSAQNKPRQINKNGALQDGKLITFPNGKAYLSNSSGSLSEKDQAFKAVIQRPETATCENFILSSLQKCAQVGKSKSQCIESPEYVSAYDTNCPSGDERGIFAARLVMEKNPSQFLRKEADLAIIILSDEDVRSGLYRAAYTQLGETHVRNSSFNLTDKDSAESFLSFMKSKYPNKKYNVHSIVVPYYTDPNCRNVQAAQTGGVVGSSFGVEYERLSAATVPNTKPIAGVRGSICSSNYTQILNDIFNNVQGQIKDKVALACANPSDLVVSLSGAVGNNPGITWTVVGDEIRFSQKLPAGTVVKGSYSCQTL